MKVVFLSLFLLTLSPPVFSYDKCDPCPPCEDPCCPPPDPCAKCAQLWPTRGPDWIITPAAGPCVDRGWNAYLTTQFIYWVTKEDHLGFAYLEPIDPISNSVNGQGRVYHPDFHFTPGFKIGVGLLYEHDGWDLYVNYTSLDVHNTKKVARIEEEFTPPLAIEKITPIGGITTSVDLTPIQKMSGNWGLDFNVIDLELGRNFFISRYLKLRPYLSLKGTWQDQIFHVKTTGLNSDELLSRGKNTNHIHDWGVGLRAGMDTAWQITRCISLFGKAAFTTLWQEIKVDTLCRAFLIEDPDSPAFTLLNVENTFHTIKPIFELTLGLRLETWFCCDTYHVSLDIGWEEQCWCDQNFFFTPFNETRTGDLSFQGLTLALRLDF